MCRLKTEDLIGGDVVVVFAAAFCGLLHRIELSINERDGVVD